MSTRAISLLDHVSAHRTRLIGAVSELSAREFFSVSGKLIPWLAVIGVFLSMTGLTTGLADEAVPATTDAAKIGLIHLPTAWIATLLLLSMAFWALLGMVSESPLCFLMAQAVAPTGGMYAFLALWSGSLWNKALTGGWWSGSAREFAMVLLLGIYVVIVSLPALIEDIRRADRWAAILAMFGASQVPFVYFLIEWIATVMGPNDGARMMKMAGGPGMLPMLLVAVGLWCHATLTGLVRLRCMIVERESGLRRMP